MAYYAATYIGPAKNDTARFIIRFDDATIDTLDSQQICRLELRIGDIVKVDLHKMRTKTYVVSGFKDKISRNTPSDGAITKEDYPLTDQYGHQTVVLTVKQRDSLPKQDQPALETVDVPITNVYITSSMWIKFNDRTFTLPGEDPHDVAPSHLHTSTINSSTPHTPASRIRRPAIATNPSRLREASVASSSTRQGSDLFATMAFAVSLTDEKERDRVARLVVEHGGTLIESSFEQLFEAVGHVPETPASKSSTGKSKTSSKPGKADQAQFEDTQPPPPPFRPTKTAQNLGFTALLATTHSRREKHIQALALNLPVLSYHWLLHSVAAGTVLAWERYLLPAGEARLLGGATRSRVLRDTYSATSPDAAFRSVFDRRDRLLDGQGVLLVTGTDSGTDAGKSAVKPRALAKSKSGIRDELERNVRLGLFISYCLGAERIERVASVEEAKKRIDDGVEEEGEDGKWKYVYFDCDLPAAEAVLFNTSAAAAAAAVGKEGLTSTTSKGMEGGTETGRGKKRTRTRTRTASIAGTGEVWAGAQGGQHQGKKRVRIVDKEWVIQSLILGALEDS
ncbi:hypothetical protein LTS18_001947 [Coniosporium uncinatum]|uniref:Uncharacterized protein n=1 Tax=Coniosporium uncinatum TaxID=93489 RepID=A0ACC3D7T4_9PEZI|nr:hypothetical protein LTS18_001947 [Coniosporium uncinatum]